MFVEKIKSRVIDAMRIAGMFQETTRGAQLLDNEGVATIKEFAIVRRKGMRQVVATNMDREKYKAALHWEQEYWCLLFLRSDRSDLLDTPNKTDSFCKITKNVLLNDYFFVFLQFEEQKQLIITNQ